MTKQHFQKLQNEYRITTDWFNEQISGQQKGVFVLAALPPRTGLASTWDTPASYAHSASHASTQAGILTLALHVASLVKICTVACLAGKLLPGNYFFPTF